MTQPIQPNDIKWSDDKEWEEFKKQAVQDELKHNRAVKRYRLGVYGEGEDGVTIAELA